MKFNTTFTRCRDGKPLLELDGTPFNGLEIRPTDLRRLGETLMWLADLGTALPTDGRDWKATKVEVDAAAYHLLTTDSAPADAAHRSIQFVQGIARAFNNTNQG